ncbi:hypothetical protein [Lactiplantibacillus pentosus]|uniref:hypothetical protein n=1 Tax=Lactiplantibacillus pentosus TaxID=1589 RepID=UPI003D7AD62D
MKLIYQYTDDGTVTGTSVVSDSYQPVTGETFTLPPAGLNTPLKYNRETDQFTGADQPEVVNPGPAVSPSDEQQLLMQQDSDIAQLKLLVMDQAKQIAILSKGSAK